MGQPDDGERWWQIIERGGRPVGAYREGLRERVEPRGQAIERDGRPVREPAARHWGCTVATCCLALGLARW